MYAKMIDFKLRFAWLVLAAALAAPAMCQQTTTVLQSGILPYASATYEHNSNVFYQPNSTVAFADNGDPQLGDSDLRTVGGADFNYLFDRQRLYATLEGRYVDYDHFKYLDHSEYAANGGLDWKLLDLFDGLVFGKIERFMAPFDERDTQTTLAIDLDRRVGASFNIRVAPEWRIETGVDYHDLNAPIQEYPEYGLTETTAKAALKYGGFANLTYGILLDYIHGEFRNAPLPGSYDQADASLTMSYQATGLSSFIGAVGYTRRDQGDSQGSTSALSGDIGYTRVVGAKTTIHAEVSRAINSYIASGGSELDTTGILNLTFQPTYKTGMTFGYQYIWSKFEGQTTPGADVAGQSYHSPKATFKLNYQALRWLLIQPYATYQRRSSNVLDLNFTGTIVGIEVLVKRPPPTQPQGAPGLTLPTAPAPTTPAAAPPPAG
jgi:hypothetical protein